MNKEVSDALHTLLHIALENKEYTTQKEQFDIVYKEIERLNNELKLYKDNHEHLNNLLQQKENIIKKIRETLDDKRSILTTHLLNGEYCYYEELLYQVDEEIRKILDKVGDEK